jgi:hypothetical protein
MGDARAGRHYRLLDRALTLSDYRAKRAKFDRSNPGAARNGDRVRFLHARRVYGFRRGHLASIVVEASPEGRVRVLTSCTEIGQGTNTVSHGLPRTPSGGRRRHRRCAAGYRGSSDSGPTVSRTCMVVGANGDGRARCARSWPGRATSRSLCYSLPQYSSHGPLRASAPYQAPPGVHWDDERYTGMRGVCMGRLCDGSRLILRPLSDPRGHSVALRKLAA